MKATKKVKRTFRRTNLNFRDLTMTVTKRSIPLRKSDGHKAVACAHGTVGFY